MPFRRVFPAAAFCLTLGLTIGLDAGSVGGARAADTAEPIEWRLAPSDAVVYDAVPWTKKDGKDVRGTKDVRTVFGHDLRDDGQYVPVTPDRRDLAAVLGLRFPKTTDATSIELRIPMRDAPTVTARGKPAFRTRPDGALEVETAWTFQSGPAEKRARGGTIAEGSARATLAFDRARRVVASSSVTIEYVGRPVGKADAKPTPVSQRVELALREIRRTRYEGFEANVNAAIDKGVAWLRKQQTAEGAFPPKNEVEWRLGTTALALLTLAECGFARDDPGVAKAIDWVVRQPLPTKTYEQGLSLTAMDAAFTPPSEEALLRSGRIKKRLRALSPEQRAWCEQTGALLLAGVASPGSWSYPAGARALLQFDSSNTQFGALGMRAMDRLGFDVPDTMWAGLIRHFEVTRERKGPRGTVDLVREGGPESGEAEKVAEVDGFLYSTRDPTPYGSMTCAGIACLELARCMLACRASPKLTPAVDDDARERVAGGWAWLDRHWGVDRNPEKPQGNWQYYYLYALERAGVFSRVRTVGGKDWYFEGAVRILLDQKDDGSWNETDGGEVVTTCFALLFLRRATPPLTPAAGK